MKNLKLFCGKVVIESNLIKSSKLQLLKYIREASETQLKAFLLYGKIVNVTEKTEEIINEKFKSSIYPDILTELGVVGNIISLAVSPFLGYYAVAWRLIAAAASEAHRRCGVLKISNDRDSCLAKVRIDESNKRISILQKAKSTCSKNKDPKQCVENLTAKMNLEQEKIQQNKEKLKKLTMKGRGGGKPSKETKLF